MQDGERHIPRLLAEMVAADGKVLEVEELNAEALIECFGASMTARDMTVDEARAQFLASLKAETAQADPEVLLAHFSHLPVPVKLDLFRAIWMIAICDGELHPQEERLAQRFADMIALGRPGSMAAQPGTEAEERFKKAG